MIKSRIKQVNGIPMLEINDELVPGNAYITYFTENACYDDFANAGYRLFSLPLYFSSRTMSEYNEIPPFSPGIFESGEPDFSGADRAFEQIIEACPGAYIFPRLNMSLPYWWEKDNIDELCDIGNIDQNRRRPCFSSDKWAEDTKKLLGKFIDHVENSSYRDHVCGYQLAAGNAEEWISFDFLGSIGKRSREKFADYAAKNNLSGTEDEYYSFLSYITAERICEFSKFVKEKTGHRLVTGSFYGYLFELTNRKSCHNALSRVLNDENVDFLCSPISYMDYREPGYDHPCMVPLDSLKLHGKLYFVENDARTHRTKPLFDIPHFHNPFYMPRDRWCAIETIKMYYARALIHGHALWWFDMGGGWYHYDEYMKLFAEFIKISKASLDKDMSSVSEVAVLIDEKALDCVHKELEEDSKNVCCCFRKQLGLMGAPYDSYMVDDYDAIKGKYKAFILLVPVMTEGYKKIIFSNPHCLVITPENADLTTEELRSFLRSQNIHIYSEKDAVIYVNKSYLFLHTNQHDFAELKLPGGIRLKQIYGDRIDIETEFLPRFTSYLFEIENS